MTSKAIISLVKSYFLTLAGGGLSLITIFLLFNDLIVMNDEGTIAYFILGTLMTFFAPVGIAIFFLLPITLLDAKHISDATFIELIKRYLPFPALILSFIFSLFLLLNEEHPETIYFVYALFMQAYSISLIQLSTYVKQLKS